MFTYVLVGSPVYMTSFCLGQSFQPKLGHCVKSGYDSKRNGTERKGTLLRLSYPPHGTSSPKSKGTWVLVTWDWKCLSSLSHERSGAERSGAGNFLQYSCALFISVTRSGAEMEEWSRELLSYGAERNREQGKKNIFCNVEG